jgi:tRNA(His) guanylyltransferase
MNNAAKEVMMNFSDIIISYGQSDEYSFIFRKSATLFNRREDKILSCLISLFSSSYALNFNLYFENQKPLKTPSFDGRIILYPSLEDLKAYLSWR